MAAADYAPGAESSKAKKKSKKCKKGTVAVTINGRRRCQSLKAALPRPRAADPRLAVATAALSVDLGKVRDRRGRRAVSVAKLLGPKGMRTAEGALKQSLVTLDRLRARPLRAAAGMSALRSPVATASIEGCAELKGSSIHKGKIKGKGFDAEVNMGTASATIGVDLDAGRIRAEVEFGICEDEDRFKAPECPDAEGTLEASDQSTFSMVVRVSRGSELLLSQQVDTSVKTEIKPIQVDDDAKLEYFEIDHTYETGMALGGSGQEFGRISLRFVYHGQTRVNYPGATYDPTNTSVDVRFDVQGVEADQLHEIRDIEFDRGLAAKRDADRNFAAAVDKVIARLAEKEERWRQPNVCATMKFDPVSDTLLLERGKSGGFKARVESKAGGAPAGAKWTLSESRNADVTPAKALANPASFTYTVTNAGKGVEVQAAFRVTSRAGVAEGTWTQPTKEPPPPPPAATFAGPFSGTAVYDENELGAGNAISARWDGDAVWKQVPPSESPSTSTYYYRLGSGSVIYRFDGTLSDCSVEGVGPIDLGAQFDLNTAVSLVLSEGEPRPFHYGLVLPMPMLVTVSGEKFDCDDPEDNGDAFDWSPAGGIPALINAPDSAGQVLGADESFSGARAGDTGGGSPDQTWNWALAPVP